MLLYSATSFDALTLERYRRFLETNITGLKFLDKTQELSDHQTAGEICDSAVRWLREATRDSTKFPLVFAENVNYGFRRNLFGLRSFAILLCLFTFAGLEIYGWIAMYGYAPAAPRRLWVAEILPIIGVMCWQFMVTPDFVKTVAFEYATKLISACDSPHLVK
jgi:hypothetical protein